MSETNAGTRATLPCTSCGRLNRVDLARAAHAPRCGHCGHPIALDRPIPVTDQSLERVLRDAPVPVLVDFYADWCGPCRMMAPVLDQIARDRAGSALIAKLDTERNPQSAARYQARSIPLLVAFRSGREVGREIGAVPRPRLEALIDGAARAA